MIVLTKRLICLLAARARREKVCVCVQGVCRIVEAAVACLFHTTFYTYNTETQINGAYSFFLFHFCFYYNNAVGRTRKKVGIRGNDWNWFR